MQSSDSEAFVKDAKLQGTQNESKSSKKTLKVGYGYT